MKISKITQLSTIGLQAFTSILLLASTSCDSIFASYIADHPENCVINTSACDDSQSCNQLTRRCEPKVVVDCRIDKPACSSNLICNPATGACEPKQPPPREPSFGVCRGAALCWDNPTPLGTDLYSIWGSGANDIWTVGKDGTILNWNGTTWSWLESSTVADLIHLFGTAPNNVWAVGDKGTIVKANSVPPTATHRSQRRPCTAPCAPRA